MTHLALALLGPMQVTVHGQTITFPYEKARALLAYLATESIYPHHRNRLAALLWEDQLESKARSNLRKALSILRQLLGDAGLTTGFTNGSTTELTTESTGAKLFLTTRNTIQFNAKPPSNTTDIAIFRQLLERHQHRRASELQPQDITDLEQAVALYRGPFLDQMQLLSESFEEWLLLNRERFQQLAVNACVTLITYSEQQQDYQKVKYYTQRQLQLEPWNEAAHQRLMQLLARQGQRTAALRQYERCRKALEQEAIEPEPTTVALGQALRSGRLPATR